MQLETALQGYYLVGEMTGEMEGEERLLSNHLLVTPSWIAEGICMILFYGGDGERRGGRWGGAGVGVFETREVKGGRRKKKRYRSSYQTARVSFRLEGGLLLGGGDGKWTEDIFGGYEVGYEVVEVVDVVEVDMGVLVVDVLVSKQ